MDVDVDNDFDGKLLDQFRSMGTTDRDVLIAQFQAVLGNSINPELCAFFLDMNNWNLQNAVCTYYDFEQPLSSLPSMAVMADITIGDGEAVAPNTCFFKSWRIKNSGNERWPPGCHIRFCSGHNLSCVERKIVDSLAPGETQDVSVDMQSPPESGTYLSLWRMCSPTGVYFGDVLNVHVEVAEGGLLGLTQQLSRIGDSTTVHSTYIKEESTNPFQVPHMDSSSSSPMLDQQLHSQVITQDPSKSKFNNMSSISAPNEDDSEML